MPRTWGTAVQCRRTEELLPVYLEGALDAAADTAVREHLSSCDACSAELAREQDLLNLLDQQRQSPSDPRLWARVRGGLAQVIDCEEVRRLLPPLLDHAVYGSAAISLAAHLEECPSCAVEEQTYYAAAAALAAAPAVEVDLWPQFERRLAAEAQRPAWTLVFLGSLVGAAPRPIVAAGLAAAAFYFGGQWLQTQPAPQSRAGTTIARAIPVETEPRPDSAETPAPAVILREKPPAPVPAAKAPPAVRRRIRPRSTRAVRQIRQGASRTTPAAPVRRQAPVEAAPVVVAAQPSVTEHASWSSMLHVEFPGSAAPPVSTGSTAAAAPEVVRAVSLLAEAGEATLETFE